LIAFLHRRIGVSGLAGLMLVFFLPVAISQAQAPPQDRILRAINSSDVTQLRGNVHPLARPEFDRGKAPDATLLPRMTMYFAPATSQQVALNQLLSQQQDRTSPNYHRWITPQEFGSRFGLSQNDLNKVTSWLEGRGFVVQEIPASRNAVTFSGSAARAAAAFRTEIHRYLVNGEQHYANASEPSIPAALGGVVSALAGLNDFRPKPRVIQRSLTPQPNFTDGNTNHFLAPADFAQIYDVNPLYSRGIDGTGQRIAIVGQSDIQVSDIQEFRSLMNLPAANPQIVLVPGSTDPGTTNGDFQEADLDLEWAGAVAKNATLIYVNSTNAWWSLQYAVTSNLAPVISVSYASCEPDVSAAEVQSFMQIGQQANAQGQTIVASAGDSGAAACDPVSAAQATEGLAVAMPASMPYVTAVGGSEFNEGSGTYWNTTNAANNGSAVSYIPEMAWNDTSAALGIEATGGGASIWFTKPMWQSSTGVPNDGVRDVPDISLSASANHDGYLVCDETFNSSTNTFTSVCPSGPFGGFDAVGGTSASTPAFAGIVALLNQFTNSPQGNINYVLYALAALSPNPLHDITTGTNTVPCQMSPPTPDCPTTGTGAGLMGYSAGSGYSAVTGLGSVDANLMMSDWSSISLPLDFDITVTPAKLTLSRGNVATAQIMVNDVGGLTGTPSFACNIPAIFVGVSCSIAPGAGPNAFTLTLTSSNSSAQLYSDVTARPAGTGITTTAFAQIVGSQARASRWRILSFDFLNFGTTRSVAGVCLLVLIVFCCFAWLTARGRATLLPLSAGACAAALLLGCAGGTSAGPGASAKIGSAPPAIQLTPAIAYLGANDQQQFTATVANSTNTAVNWSVTPGLGKLSVLDSSASAASGASGAFATGLYTAPPTFSAGQSVTVTATSGADPTKQASANIVLLPSEAGSIQLTGTLNGKAHTVAISLSVK
jgi:hypothetical protein